MSRNVHVLVIEFTVDSCVFVWKFERDSELNVALAAVKVATCT